MEENGQSQAQPQQPVASPGAQLAARRQALGWTIEQVANQLNLAPRQVQAIESDNYAALPGIVIARGFVRAYAKLLKLDPAPLLGLIAEKDAPSPESLELRRTLSATFTESSLPAAKRSGSGGKWLALALLLAVAGAAGWLAWRDGWLNGLQLPAGITAGMTSDTTAPAPRTQPEAPATSEAGGNGVPMGQAEEGAQAAPAESPPQSASQVPPAPPATAPAPVAPQTKPNTPGVPAAGTASVQAPAPAAAAVPPVQSRAGSQAASGSAEKLVLKMREASWIELKREDGSAVVSRLVPAGSTESFDVGPGARLVVGNAGGVDATYRGQALDLKADAKNNVARLNLK